MRLLNQAPASKREAKKMLLITGQQGERNILITFARAELKDEPEKKDRMRKRERKNTEKKSY